MPSSLVDLRPATLADAALVSDLDLAIAADESRDPAMMAFYWQHLMAGEKAYRMISTREGAARMFVAAGHGMWTEGEPRFGWGRVRIHPEDWSADGYRQGVELAERWLGDEGASVAVARVREDFAKELAVLASLGYAEVRRARMSRLDLERTRADMERQGITMQTLDVDTDPDNLNQLYELDIEATEDIPKTVPWPVPTLEEWRHHWFDHPGHRADRLWLARDGGRLVGLSMIGYPPSRGIPWTSFTCIARSARGRGVARALKYRTVVQAIELGASLIETQNDAANAPIIHLNDEMGYRPTEAIIELHRDL